MALTVVALALYGLLAAWFWFRKSVTRIALTVGYFRTRPRPNYMLWVTIGCTTMAIGFAARIPMTNDPYGLTIYIVTTLVSFTETAINPSTVSDVSLPSFRLAPSWPKTTSSFRTLRHGSMPRTASFFVRVSLDASSSYRTCLPSSSKQLEGV